MSLPEIKETNQEFEENIENLNKNNQITENLLITEPTGIPVIETKLSKYLRQSLRRIEKRKPKDLGSIYERKKVKVRKYGNFAKTGFINNYYKEKLIKEKGKFNVFEHEDNRIKELMTQFKEQNIRNRIPKLRRKKMAFNKLYDLTNKSVEKIKNLKNSKKLYSLEKYQENLLMAIEPNSMDHNEIMNLKQTFFELKTDSNNVSALPPININVIRTHIINNSKKNSKKKNMKEIFNDKIEPLDEYEKEMRIIKNIKCFKSQPKFRRNKNLEMLPEYIRNLFTKK